MKLTKKQKTLWQFAMISIILISSGAAFYISQEHIHAPSLLIYGLLAVGFIGIVSQFIIN